MALNKLTATLLNKNPSNLQKVNIIDSYEKIGNKKYKSTERFKSIDTSNQELQKRYDNWKEVNNLPFIYREIGEKYGKLGVTSIVSHATVDIERYHKFVKTPKGKGFLVKQAGLQLMQPKTHNVILQGTRIFNPIKFEANIPGWITGFHEERHGVIGLTNNYEKVVNQTNTPETQFDNRMIRIWRELGHDQVFNNVLKENKYTEFLNKIRGIVSKVRKFLGVSYEGKIIQTISGIGGPKSIFGIGYTDIRSYPTGINISEVNGFSDVSKYKDLYQDQNYSELNGLKVLFYGPFVGIGGLNIPSPGNLVATKNKSGFSGGKLLNSYEITKYNNYQNQSTFAGQGHNYNTKELGGNPKKKSERFNDFRKIKPLNSKNYLTNNIHVKYRIPNTGEIDPIYSDENINNIDDFILLKFAYVNEELTTLQFRATITGLTNNFAPEWNSVDYVGRPDSVKTYKGVNRTVSFSFMIAANSKSEMETIYRKLNKLAGMTTPSFQIGNKMFHHMVAPIIKLKLGNYINDEPGNLSSLDFTIDDDYVWDIDNQEPMYFTVNVSFEIIGTNTPKRGINYFGRIANKNLF